MFAAEFLVTRTQAPGTASGSSAPVACPATSLVPCLGRRAPGTGRCAGDCFLCPKRPGLGRGARRDTEHYIGGARFGVFHSRPSSPMRRARSVPSRLENMPHRIRPNPLMRSRFLLTASTVVTGHWGWQIRQARQFHGPLARRVQVEPGPPARSCLGACGPASGSVAADRRIVPVAVNVLLIADGPSA